MKFGSLKRKYEKKKQYRTHTKPECHVTLLQVTKTKHNTIQ